MCERTVLGVYVCKISSAYLEKWLSFGILKVEKGHFFTLIPATSIFSLFSNFVRFQIFKKCSTVIFRALDEKLS